MEVKEVPRPVLAAIAQQVGVPASAFASYGERENTLYEHLDEFRRACGFRSCGWREYLLVARSLLPDAMESDRPLPLIEARLERLRTKGILAPNMIHIERLVWIVLKIAERRLLRTLTQLADVGATDQVGWASACGYEHSRRDAPELVTAGSWRDFSQEYQTIGRAPVVSARTVTSCAPGDVAPE